MIYWLTGQPGAGKTTLGQAMKKALAIRKEPVTHVDADDWRKSLKNNDYTEAGRRLNVTSAQEYAEFLSDQGDTVICSFVSPYRDLREAFKKRSMVVEVYLHTDQVRGKEHYHVANYEPPLKDFVDIDSGVLTVDQEVNAVLDAGYQI